MHPSLPPVPLHCLFVCPTFLQQACQKNWTRQLSNPAGLSEDGRWNLFFLFLASSCTLASKHPLWHYRLSSALFRPNKGGREGPLSSRLARVFTSERDDHKEAADPSCAPSGIYSPCHFVITPSHASIPLPNLATLVLIHMQKAPFVIPPFVFFGLTRLWDLP